MEPHLHDLLTRLEQTRGRVKAAVQSLPEHLRGRRPDEGGWSALEVVEHLALVELAFSRRAADAIAEARKRGRTDATTDSREPLSERVRVSMADRSRPRSAPEAVHPTGQLDELGATEALETAAAHLRAVMIDADGVSLGGTTIVHSFFGTLSLYQVLELMAGHEERHTLQILELAGRLQREEPVEQPGTADRPQEAIPLSEESRGRATD